MRVASLVIAGYLLAVIVSACWPLLPYPMAFATAFSPSLAALTATYLGFSSRDGLVAAVLGSVVAAYLIDIAGGGIVAISCTPAAAVALMCGVIRGRFTLRRPWMIAMVCMATVLSFYGVQGVLLALLQPAKAMAIWPMASIVGIAVTSALMAPLAFAVFRRVDAALSRTVRDRDAVLEGRL
ncbi:MAG: hypothetical protein IPL79_06570 [Myxococcales bacterium]|nr:hypothetical protein [Myxococcales bacterium]